MNDLFTLLLFSHVIGDFFLQPAAMATKKGSANWMCVLHCLIYATSVCAFTKFAPLWFLFIFVSHYIVDRYSVADKWLRMIKGRDLEGFLARGHEGIPKGFNKENYLALRAAFSAICYVIVDNSIHLMSMYYFAKYLWT